MTEDAWQTADSAPPEVPVLVDDEVYGVVRAIKDSHGKWRLNSDNGELSAPNGSYVELRFVGWWCELPRRDEAMT